MGARRWGRARGTSRSRTTVHADAAARSFRLRAHAPSVLLIIGLLLLTGAIMAAAPAAQAKPLRDTHTWTGAADGLNWSQPGNWMGGQLPSSDDDLVFPSPDLGATYAGARCLNNDFLTSVHSVTIGTEGYPSDVTVGGSALGMSGQLTAYGANTWAVTSTTATGPLVIQNNVYTPPAPENPDDPWPEYFSTLTISGDIHLMYGGVGHPLTLGLASEGDRTYEAIAVSGDIDGSDPACGVTLDGHGTVTFAGANAWGGDLTSENGFVCFRDPASLPATSAVHLGTTDYSYGMAYFDFSGLTGHYTLPNVFIGHDGHLVPERHRGPERAIPVGSPATCGSRSSRVDGPRADVTVSGKLGGTIALAWLRHAARHGHGERRRLRWRQHRAATSPRAPPTPMWACCTPRGW